MNIKHYDHRHDTVEEVRNCTSPKAGSSTQQPLPHTEPLASEHAARKDAYLDAYKASERQVNFVQELSVTAVIREHKWPDEVVHIVDEVMQANGITMREAGTAIEFLKKHQPPKAELPDVPSGRYALHSDDGVLRFYQVDRPTEGKWAGYTFTNQLFGSPGSFRKQRVSPYFLLPKLLQVGIIESAKLYGQEVGECGVCHSPLTNEESRAYGIGPICRGKRGW